METKESIVLYDKESGMQFAASAHKNTLHSFKRIKHKERNIKSKVLC